MSGDSRLRFFKENIKKVLLENKEDIGELRYKLYVEMVERTNDYEELKEMADLEMQIDMLKYTKRFIRQPLNERNVELGDIKSVLEPHYNDREDMDYTESEVEEILDNPEYLDLMAFELSRRLGEMTDEERNRVYVQGQRVGMEVNDGIDDEDDYTEGYFDDAEEIEEDSDGQDEDIEGYFCEDTDEDNTNIDNEEINMEDYIEEDNGQGESEGEYNEEDEIDMEEYLEEEEVEDNTGNDGTSEEDEINMEDYLEEDGATDGECVESDEEGDIDSEDMDCYFTQGPGEEEDIEGLEDYALSDNYFIEQDEEAGADEEEYLGRYGDIGDGLPKGNNDTKKNEGSVFSNKKSQDMFNTLQRITKGAENRLVRTGRKVINSDTFKLETEDE